MNALAEFLARIFGELKWPQRILSFLILGFILIWIDSQMGFTYHYFTERKINEIERYNLIVNNPSLDSATKALLLNERLSVINKNRGLLEPLKRGEPGNSIMFHVSYSWIYVILILFSYKLLRNNDPYASTKVIWGQVAWIVSILAIEAFILYFLASAFSRYIQHFFLYVLNTILQISFLLITFWLSTKINVSKKK